MDLQTLWFILVTVLFCGFFFLEGFDYGVGILLPFVGKQDQERRMVINSIGPVWDGNEVWLLTAGGAMFAAFPNWYATLFSGFYLALFLILVALIVRGVAFEFRSKDERPGWRRTWDIAIFIGSALPALLWGVAVANIVRGVPIDSGMHYAGTFFDLLNPYSLLGGLVTLSIFILYGALFLQLKTEGAVRERVERIARVAWAPVLVLVLAFVGFSAFQTDMFATLSVVKIAALLVAVVALVGAIVAILVKRYGLAFIGTGVAILGTVVLLFGTLFPRVMPSSLGAANDLTIYNASSSPYTLQVMTIVALTLVPIVLAYQAWTYWVFRKRITTQTHLEY
jgi:cytochrome bd ubiquinol oxidase subunit II